MSRGYEIEEGFDALFRAYHLGAVSVEKLLLVVLVGSVALLLVPSLIGFWRSSSRNVTRAAQRDVLIGIACLVPVITFIGFFIFVGRGYYTAFFAESE